MSREIESATAAIEAAMAIYDPSLGSPPAVSPINASEEFQEHLVEEGYYPHYCDIYTEMGGIFVSVETDPYEGHAMMSLPLAKKAHEALGRAIAHAESLQASKGF